MQLKYEELLKAYQIELTVWEEKRSVLGKLLQKKLLKMNLPTLKSWRYVTIWHCGQRSHLSLS